MADPFAILANSQLNVPALLNTYQNARQSRLQEMLVHRQIEREDKRDEQEANNNRALSKAAGAFSGMASVYDPRTRAGGTAATPGIAGPTGGGDPSTSAFDRRLDPAYDETKPDPLAGAPQQLVDPSQLPPRSDGVQLNHGVMREILADPSIDYATKKQIQDMFYQATAKQFEDFQRKGIIMADMAGELLAKPEAEWGPIIQSMIPQLAQMGVTPDMLTRENITREALQKYARTGRLLGAVARGGKPPERTLVKGALINNETLNEDYVSPIPETITGPNGEVRPLWRPGQAAYDVTGEGGAPNAPPSADALRAQAAEAIRQGADPAKVNQRLNQMLQGGASPSGSPTFR